MPAARYFPCPPGNPGPSCHNWVADRTYTSGRTTIGAVPAVPARCLMDKLLLSPAEVAETLGI